MYYQRSVVLAVISATLFTAPLGAAANDSGDADKQPTKVYVPYKDLKGVFESEKQGVFLPYREFQHLWRAAQDKPAGIAEAPYEHLISTARFTGNVEGELGKLRLELTIDILKDDWVEVPVGLAGVAVSKATIIETDSSTTVPLLRVVNGQYVFVTRGKGRYVLALDFVRQLDTQPGLAVLKYRIPSAAITTLELLIPQENLKVDVSPMLAATTSQMDGAEGKATRLQAFLGSAQEVTLSWKPRTEAAEELEPVIIAQQFQHINISEALISHDLELKYDIHRGGVRSFSILLPEDFRVTSVSGVNIAKWDVDPNATAGQKLGVELFSPAKGNYGLTVRMERFLHESRAELDLQPIRTEKVLRQSGLIGITYSPRRSVHLEQLANLARVDTGQLPKTLQNRPKVTAYRFITTDYSAKLIIDTTSPRISVNQQWVLGVDADSLELRGRLRHKIERTGVFELNMTMPEPWKVESVGPESIVDDFDLKGSGPDRVLHVLLKQEKTGDIELQVKARADRDEAAGTVDFVLPSPDSNDLQQYDGELVLMLANQLQAKVAQTNQLQSMPVNRADKWGRIANLSPVMAFEFRAVDLEQPAGAQFQIDVKPVQISATVHRLVDIEAGSLSQQSVLQYRVRYAPVDTFYIKMPAETADAGVQISGANIKEKPRIDDLPQDQASTADANGIEWAYYRIVLQSKVTGSYELRVDSRSPFKPGEVGNPAKIDVQPVLAAGKLSDQNGYIAVAKADTLAIGEPEAENLISADAGSAADLPYGPHRQKASLAFKYNSPPFSLVLPVVAQKEAKVFTTIVKGAIIEQVVARDGMVNTHATYLLATSQGDRLPVVLPEDAELTAVLLNGNEAPVEMGVAADERIVRLPPSAGQVSRFVLEISYGLRKASTSGLQAPKLPDEIPVQQTLWRLWLPEDYRLLHHGRVFSQISSNAVNHMLARLGSGQPSPVSFKLTGQGRIYNFLRQGAPGRLNITVMSGPTFSILVWVVILAAGVAMLKLGGFRRVLVLVAIFFAGGIVHLFAPLFVERVVDVGAFAGLLVLLLWAGQWTFQRLPELKKELVPRRRLRKKTEAPPDEDTAGDQEPDAQEQSDKE